jgi:hypothetical protein
VPTDWSVIDASTWDLAGEETIGIRAHIWLRHASRNRTWLFKETVVEPDRPFHEDLTEKLASEVASLVGIPAARVQLARRAGHRGCLVEDVRWSRGSHQPGQVLLGGAVEGYDQNDRTHQGHSVANIRLALDGFAAPPGSPTPAHFHAFDVFAGYLVFDALIANGDRHDGNWAVLQRPPGDSGPDALCGSYDHASSLGFNLSDGQRAQRLRDGNVRSWADRGKAREFEKVPGQRIQSLVELAHSAIALCSDEVSEYWLAAVRSVQSDAIRTLLEATPDLSEVTRTFTHDVIMINRERLADAS